MKEAVASPCGNLVDAVLSRSVSTLMNLFAPLVQQGRFITLRLEASSELNPKTPLTPNRRMFCEMTIHCFAKCQGPKRPGERHMLDETGEATKGSLRFQEWICSRNWALSTGEILGGRVTPTLASQWWWWYCGCQWLHLGSGGRGIGTLILLKLVCKFNMISDATVEKKITGL